MALGYKAAIELRLVLNVTAVHSKQAYLPGHPIMPFPCEHNELWVTPSLVGPSIVALRPTTAGHCYLAARHSATSI